MAKTTIAVRPVQKWDLWALELLLAKGIEESDGLLPDYDPLHFAHTAINMIAAGLIYVAVEIDEAAKQEKIVGCLAMEAKSWSWNADVRLIESVHFYVLPEVRGRQLADGKTPVWEGLLKAGQALADGAGMPLRVEILHKLDDRGTAKDELMKRAGFSYTGGNHLYLPKAAAQQAAE